MQIRHDEFSLDTQGDSEIHDITAHAQKVIDNSGLTEGTCTVFIAHTTCGITTIEYEPGCNADLKRVMEDVAPQHDRWEHNEINADTNGHSHARAGMIGPSVTIPFTGGEMMLGVWQKIICVDFDDRPRVRRVVVTLIGQ